MLIVSNPNRIHLDPDMESLAFNDAVNQLEVYLGVHIPADTRAVCQKIFQVYGEYLSVSDGALGLLRLASLELLTKLDSDIEEIMLDGDLFLLDRAFVELKELERDLDSQRSFYLPRVRKEYNILEEKWKEFVQKWLPTSGKSFLQMDNTVDLLFQLHDVIVALRSQECERVDNIDHSSSEASRIHTIIYQLGRKFHDDYLKNLVLSPNMIVELASSSVRIPPSHLSRQLNLTPEGVQTHFFSTLIGLDHIISFIVETISKKKPSGCPLGSFLLLGCHGRGRTELARTLAKQLFDHEDMLVVCDISDYQDANSGPRFRDDLCGDTLLGKLVDISKRKAYGILMLANVEKASPSVLEMIVSILREGIFKNCEGTIVCLTDVLVLMKSNIGNDVFLTPCRCLDNVWKVKQMLSGHQQLQLGHNGCYYKSFLEKTSMHFPFGLLNHLDEVLVLPHPSPLKYSEIARIQLRKLIPEMSSAMQKKVVVYLSQASLHVDLIALIDNGGHASEEWLEKKICPELLKSCGDGIEDLAIVYIDELVGTDQLSCRVESNGHLLNDKIYGKFRKTLRNLRKIHRRNKIHVKMIHKLGVYAHNVQDNAGLMLRIIAELLEEAYDFKQMLEDVDMFDWEEECQKRQMSIQKKAKHDFMDHFSKFCDEFVESNQTTRIIQALLESIRDAPPVNNDLQRPHSFLFLGLHLVGRADLAVGLSKCYAPDSPVIEVDLSLCSEPDSIFRCTCKGKPGELFVDAMRGRSRSIIVFYEFEIAHISVFSNILSILDHGFLSGNDGNDIEFHNSIIIFVSNCGNREMISALFGIDNDDTREGLRFRAEFLNRVDEIVFFNPSRVQQFDVVKRLPVRSGLPAVSRKWFTTYFHDLFYSGKISYDQKMRLSWCLRKMMTET